MIPNQWLSWINENVKLGCDQATILDVMVKASFDEAEARQAIEKSILNGGEPPAIEGVYSYEASFLRTGNTVQLSDRKVEIGFRLAQPHVAVINNLLSSAECEALIKAARPKLARSAVVNGEGGTRIDQDRTSQGAHFQTRENKLVSVIEKRINELVGWPIENGEGIQVLHYGPGAEYRPHFDYFDIDKPGGKECISKGGQRVATLVMYLNDVEEGGETMLPEVHLTVSPKRGSALYFSYYNSLGQLDKNTLHSSLPVIKGEKWVATKWIRRGAFTG